MDDAVIDQTPQPLLAKRVPAGVEAPLVFCDVFIMGMQRPVRRGVSDVLEESRAGTLLFVLPDIGGRLIADRVGIKERRILLGFVLDVVVTARQRARVVEAASSNDGAEEMVEAALQRPGVRRLREVAGDVPLA